MQTQAESCSAISSWRRALAWYLRPPDPAKSVIAWWEKRRLLYNAFLLLLGVLNILLSALSLWVRFNRLPQTADSRVSFFDCLIINEYLLVALIILQITANVWYTGGWIVDLIVRWFPKGKASNFSKYALLAGTSFSFAFAEFIYAWVYKVVFINGLGS